MKYRHRPSVGDAVQNGCMSLNESRSKVALQGDLRMKLIHRILDLAPVLLAILAFVLWVAAIWTDDARWCGMAILMTVTTVIVAVASVP